MALYSHLTAKHAVKPRLDYGCSAQRESGLLCLTRMGQSAPTPYILITSYLPALKMDMKSCFDMSMLLQYRTQGIRHRFLHHTLHTHTNTQPHYPCKQTALLWPMPEQRTCNRECSSTYCTGMLLSAYNFISRKRALNCGCALGNETWDMHHFWLEYASSRENRVMWRHKRLHFDSKIYLSTLCLKNLIGPLKGQGTHNTDMVVLKWGQHLAVSMR